MDQIMKQTLTLLTALLLGSLPPARADLVAHFRFDSDLKDATGQHNGRPVDPKLAPKFAPGRLGSAVVIEKVNAGIELANSSAIDFSRASAGAGRNLAVSGVRTRDSQTDLPIGQTVKVVELKLNPDYPKTTPKGGSGKGIWIR